jgi:uncharacterized membrane protein (DUF106 family)
VLTLSVFVDLVRIPVVHWTEVNFFKSEILERNNSFDRARQRISRYRLKRLSNSSDRSMGCM